MASRIVRWRVGGVAGAAAQERKAALQPGQQGRRSEEGDAGGGQLDGERQALQPGAQTSATAGAFATLKAWLACAALARPTKSCTASLAARSSKPSGRRRVRQCQGGDDKDVFAGEA